MLEDELLSPRDVAFLLYEVLGALELTERPRFADHGRETFDAALESARRIAGEKFSPHLRRLDEQEPQLLGGRVVLADEVGAAVRAYRDAGFCQATEDFDAGGMQMPMVVAQACWSYFRSANIGTTSYLGLTAANAKVIERFGSSALKRKYLPALRSGRFFGTMALTEPQAGSSLSDLTTAARPLADGRYALRGRKVFISGGDHELAENIIHLVLARLSDAPPGVKGLSLFAVPKYHVDEEGRIGARNDVALAGLIHKCGWRGTTSTMLNFGEADACVGELVGAVNDGLAAMFHMMNDARIGVGLGAAVLGYRGYLAALKYARERPQGRHPGSKDAREPQRLLVEHADVRRMLLAQKAYVEGGLALGLYAARLVDEQQTAADAIARERAGALLDLLTPVVKSWPSQFCLEANSLAIQVHGGYGYTRDFVVEQLWRDNRLNMIHEGTHGIQAMDLLGRKLWRDEGAARAELGRLILADAQRALQGAKALQEFAAPLRQAWERVEGAAQALGPRLAQDPRVGLANATAFLEAFGHVVVAWLWLRQATAACARLPAELSERESAFYRGKLQACRWFFRWELPRIEAPLSLTQQGDDTALSMGDPWF